VERKTKVPGWKENRKQLMERQRKRQEEIDENTNMKNKRIIETNNGRK
jgi:response regulator of citrate/malate metabolism